MIYLHQLPQQVRLKESDSRPNLSQAALGASTAIRTCRETRMLRPQPTVAANCACDVHARQCAPSTPDADLNSACIRQPMTVAHDFLIPTRTLDSSWTAFKCRCPQAQKRRNPGQESLTGVSKKCLTMSYFHMGTPTLSSALCSFTSEFEMDSGGSYTLCSSDKLVVSPAPGSPERGTTNREFSDWQL